ncbi:cytochrome P450 3A24 [Lingula anatina]|uniref:Cytochrome P450 3A24 n=1 Tax=Lingula anatina TaxID=7574 RepID=A0A1S3HZT4_LINAN|nr:cytochrome P450 3A24 [Lingula anatina]|eukprot:XP_013391527.1 cytochrome P450 3A24 [Lingula anatina]
MNALTDDMEVFFLPSWVIILLAVAVLTLVYLLYLHYAWDNRRRFGLPGPAPLPLFGHIVEIMKEGICGFDLNAVRAYGNVLALSSGLMGNALGDVMISDPDMIKEILVKQANVFVDRNINGEAQISPLEKALFAVKGDYWKQMRNTLTPTFTSGKLRHMQTMISKCAQTLVDNLKKKANTGEKFDSQIWGCYTMDVICATAFGVEVDSLNNPNHPFVVNADRFNNINLGNPLVLMLFLCPRFMKMFEPILPYVPGVKSYVGPIKYFSKTTENLLQDRRLTNDGQYKDFLQLMLNAHKLSTSEMSDDEKQDEKLKKRVLTTEEIAANGMGFFAAGFSTTKDTLGYIAYLLATHPQVQERLVQEIDDVLQDADPTHDNVSKLTYLEQVINESMRLYPVGIRLDRLADQDTTVNGLFIPKGTAVAIPTFAIHLHPEYYPEPEKFDPDRFSPEAKAKRNPYTYLPFGMGPRSCIGMRLAMLEMKMVLAKVLQNLTFKTCEETQIPMVLSKSRPMKPEKEIWLKVEERAL